ncbi:MAG: YciI family protein [Planctomycetota bacterium]|nr:MAG: YciI family protein [Planctomycetota bacterium]
MRYLLLIYSDESYYGGLSDQENMELMQAYGAFHAELEASGAYLDSARLQPTPNATAVRVREGKRLTSDGPFAETKEQLGGYYLIEAADLDAALAWAAKIPSAKYGSIEVRPIWEMEEEMQAMEAGSEAE